MLTSFFNFPGSLFFSLPTFLSKFSLPPPLLGFPLPILISSSGKLHKIMDKLRSYSSAFGPTDLQAGGGDGVDDALGVHLGHAPFHKFCQSSSLFWSLFLVSGSGLGGSGWFGNGVGTGFVVGNW